MPEPGLEAWYQQTDALQGTTPAWATVLDLVRHEAGPGGPAWDPSAEDFPSDEDEYALDVYAALPAADAHEESEAGAAWEAHLAGRAPVVQASPGGGALVTAGSDGGAPVTAGTGRATGALTRGTNASQIMDDGTWLVHQCSDRDDTSQDSQDSNAEGHFAHDYPGAPPGDRRRLLCGGDRCVLLGSQIGSCAGPAWQDGPPAVAPVA